MKSTKDKYVEKQLDRLNTELDDLESRISTTNLESEAKLENENIVIRPFMPEDAPLFTALFKVLSPTTIYHRFFGALKELNPEMLARLTQIDYDREISLVAIDENIDESSQLDKMMGVARIIGDPDGKTGEFAVLVGDAWQGEGIGSSLLEKCLSIAEKRGFETVYGIVLQDNRNMLALGEKLGFEIKRDSDSGDNELAIHLGGNKS